MRDFIERGANVQHILRGIVVHLADFADVVVQRGDLQTSSGGQDGLGLSARVQVK